MKNLRKEISKLNIPQTPLVSADSSTRPPPALTLAKAANARGAIYKVNAVCYNLSCAAIGMWLMSLVSRPCIYLAIPFHRPTKHNTQGIIDLPDPAQLLTVSDYYKALKQADLNHEQIVEFANALPPDYAEPLIIALHTSPLMLLALQALSDTSYAKLEKLMVRAQHLVPLLRSLTPPMHRTSSDSATCTPTISNTTNCSSIKLCGLCLSSTCRRRTLYIISRTIGTLSNRRSATKQTPFTQTVSTHLQLPFPHSD